MFIFGVIVSDGDGLRVRGKRSCGKAQLPLIVMEFFRDAWVGPTRLFRWLPEGKAGKDTISKFSYVKMIRVGICYARACVVSPNDGGRKVNNTLEKGIQLVSRGKA